MIDRDTTLADFNMHMSQFSVKLFMVAGRFFDIDPKSYERLSCVWYSRHGWRELKDDRYIGKLANGQDAIRYHSVDAIALENPELDETAQIIYDGWMARKKQLASMRGAPDIKIEPPKATPIELPPLEPEPPVKTPRPEWRVKLGVYLALGTPVILLLSNLLGPPWNVLAKFVWELVKTINGG